jgi:hypothetical protein
MTPTVTPTVTPTPKPQFTLYMPLAIGQMNVYTLSGQVLDESNKPISGVAIVDSSGRTGITDNNGVYTISVAAGSHALAPSLDGYRFAPAVADVDVPDDMVAQDFQATAACIEGVSRLYRRRCQWRF